MEGQWKSEGVGASKAKESLKLNWINFQSVGGWGGGLKPKAFLGGYGYFVEELNTCSTTLLLELLFFHHSAFFVFI